MLAASNSTWLFALLVSHVDGQCNIDGCTGGASAVAVAQGPRLKCTAAHAENSEVTRMPGLIAPRAESPAKSGEWRKPAPARFPKAKSDGCTDGLRGCAKHEVARNAWKELI